MMQTMQRGLIASRPNIGSLSSISGATIDHTEMLLIEKCKCGESTAWDRLIRRFEGPVYKFAYSLSHSSDEADDITGQVFLRLYQNLHTYRYEAGFTSWLFRIVKNTYLDLCVRPAHRNNLSLDATTGPDGETSCVREIMDPTPGPESRCIKNETSRLLARAIRHLPAYQRDVVRMYHAEGKSYEEIASATGLSIGTVKSRLNRARNMLRERLDPVREMLLVA